MTGFRYSPWLAAVFVALAHTPAIAHPEAETVDPAAFSVPAQAVPCTLEDGTETTCYQLTVGYMPTDLEIGPFCPATLEEAGGIWNWPGKNAGLYRVDGAFLQMLDDLGYRFFDADGIVHTVDNATRRPSVDHACIMVTADETVELTMLVPITPVLAAAPQDLGVVAKVGVSLDGVPIFADAPSIQQTGHMPVLDVCGGHVDPGGWYHWHATSSDIETVYEHAHVDADCSQPQDSSALFGFAFDGFAIYGSTESDGSSPVGLDACGGHEGPDGYHYHASETFPNLPPCLVGVQAVGNFATTAQAGIGSIRPEGGDRPGPGHPDGGPNADAGGHDHSSQ